jgi:uncharacterized protein (TIGR02284 family)
MTPVPPVPPVIDPAGKGRPFGDPPLAEGSDWDAVATARTRTLDAGQGFQKMAEHAEPSFAPIVQAFLELHTRHAAELTRILTDAGQTPDDDGSMMGTINRLVVATRALVDDIDGDVLKQIHSGEENVASAYRDALSANVPPSVRDRLATMLAELNELLDDTRPIG